MAHENEIINEELKVPSWDELLESMNNASKHPKKTGWDIYKYLKQNTAKDAVEPLTSEQARALLACYVKIPLERPSLLHSLILNVALWMANKYPDFKFGNFLYIWGWPSMLRDEDRVGYRSKDGRCYSSLMDKVERHLQSYLLHHAEERKAYEESSSIMTMVAIKIFETNLPPTPDGKRQKRRTVKLIGPEGEELLADSRIFPCKPWEIMGRLFDVLVKTSKEGNARAAEVVLSEKHIEKIFNPTIGYVDSYDEKHRHFHIFDNLSRHFVAESPNVRIGIGEFVLFSPIIPAEDKFKSAVVIRQVASDDGAMAFGLLDAVVKYVNEEQGYFYYQLTSEPPKTPEGIFTLEASATFRCTIAHTNPQAANAPGIGKVVVGQALRLLVFLKRGKDGAKHNYVARAWRNE
ncbi:MAG: hypothetical protein KBT12_01640 [Bacteroidales bacterium]|nr:hypothetical protein [Candidatus Physcousia equi]